MGTSEQDSANHILEHNFIRSTMTSDFWRNDEMWGKVIAMSQAALVESHQAAVEILNRCNGNREPFVLFLRGFELEAYDWVPQAGREEERVQTTWISGPVPLEQPLADQIAPLAPVIALANPSNLAPSRTALPRLALPSSDWKGTIRALIATAEAVIVSLESLAAGVVAELSLVRALSKTLDTIVILPPRDGRSSDGTAHILRALGADVAEPVRISRERLHLSGFPRVVHEDELDLADLSTAPQFSRITKQLAWAGTLSAEHREKRWQAAKHNQEGVALMAQREFDQAEQALTAALTLRVEIAGEEAVVNSLSNLAVLAMEKGDYVRAAACLRELVPRAHRIDQPSTAGLALTYLGEAYRSVGDLGRAVDNFREGLALLEQTGSAQDQLNAAMKLCRIYYEAGEMDEARRYMTRLEELQAAQAADPFAPQAPAEEREGA